MVLLSLLFFSCSFLSYFDNWAQCAYFWPYFLIWTSWPYMVWWRHYPWPPHPSHFRYYYHPSYSVLYWSLESEVKGLFLLVPNPLSLILTKFSYLGLITLYGIMTSLFMNDLFSQFFFSSDDLVPFLFICIIVFSFVFLYFFLIKLP